MTVNSTKDRKNKSPLWDRFCLCSRLSCHIPAIIDTRDGLSISYSQLLLKAVLRATALQELGIKLVILEETDTFDDIVTMLACAKNAITLIYIHSSNSSDYDICALANASTGNTLLRRDSAKISHVSNLITLKRTNIQTECADYFEVFVKQLTTPLQTISKEAFILTRTSGTTGCPKIIWFSQTQILRRTTQSINLFNIESTDRILACSPLFHSLGQRHVFIALLTGATLLRTFPFSISLWSQSVQLYSPTFWIPVSTHLTILESLLSERPDFLDSFRTIVSSSSPLDPSLISAISTNSSIAFCEIYGTTETACATYLNKATGPTNSVGFPVPGCDIRIESPNAEGVGEILIKNDCMFNGYMNIDCLEKISDDGYFKSGDLGKLDDHGYLYYYGRKQESFHVFGKLVYPSYLENLILNLGIFSRCQVFAIETSFFGNVIGLAIELDPSFSVDQIIGQLRKAIPGDLLPAKIIKIPSFPLLPSGKQDRRKVSSIAMELIDSSI